MRPLKRARSRQVKRQKQRQQKPAIGGGFEQRRHASHGEINRQGGKRDQPDREARSDEEKMARERARVHARRRMNERLDIGAKRFQETHRMQLNRGVVRWRTAPSPASRSWQMSLKRSLSERASPHPNRPFAAIRDAACTEPALMVNNSFPGRPSIGQKRASPASNSMRKRAPMPKEIENQSFKFSENSRRIRR